MIGELLEVLIGVLLESGLERRINFSVGREFRLALLSWVRVSGVRAWRRDLENAGRGPRGVEVSIV